MWNPVGKIVEKIDYYRAVKTKKVKISGLDAEMQPFTQFKAYIGGEVKNISYLSKEEFKEIEDEELIPIKLTFKDGSELRVLVGYFVERGEIGKRSHELDENARKSGTNEFVVKEA